MDYESSEKNLRVYMMGNCKNCEFWREGVCHYGLDYDPPHETAFYADAIAADDTDLSCWIVTGPDFGCVKFTPRDKESV